MSYRFVDSYQAGPFGSCLIAVYKPHTTHSSELIKKKKKFHDIILTNLFGRGTPEMENVYREVQE
jgi:hypothetical protein